jgi:predicted ATPase
MRQGLHDYRATGAQSWVPYYGALLAEQLGQAGFVEEASAVLNEARDAAKRASDRFFWEAELLRLEGELRLCSRSTEAREAEKKFSECDYDGAGPARKVIGTSLLHQPRTPLAQPGQGAASARTVGSGVRL